MKLYSLFITTLILKCAVYAEDTTLVDTRFYSQSSEAIRDNSADSGDILDFKYQGFTLGKSQCEKLQMVQEHSDTIFHKGFGIDFLIEPLLWFQFGNFSDPIESAFGVMPQVRLHGWKGSMVSIRPNITFYDELNTKKGYQGGLYVLGQSFQLFDSQWITATFGAFTADRWGWDGHWLGVFADKHLFTELQLGGTGYLSFDDSLYTFSKPDRITGVGKVGWYFPTINLMVQGEGGRYLWKDWGGGITLDRKFRSVSIAISGLYSPRGVNGGFAVTMPLWRGKHPQIGRVRYGLADSYRFKYRFKGYQPPTHIYETGNDLIQKVIDYQTLTTRQKK